jgi:hypothetical protein
LLASRQRRHALGIGRVLIDERGAACVQKMTLNSVILVAFRGVTTMKSKLSVALATTFVAVLFFLHMPQLIQYRLRGLF